MAMLSAILTDLGWLLSGCLLVIVIINEFHRDASLTKTSGPLKYHGHQFFWMSQSRLVLDHPFCENSFIRCCELHAFLNRKPTTYAILTTCVHVIKWQNCCTVSCIFHSRILFLKYYMLLCYSVMNEIFITIFRMIANDYKDILRIAVQQWRVYISV